MFEKGPKILSTVCKLRYADFADKTRIRATRQAGRESLQAKSQFSSQTGMELFYSESTATRRGGAAALPAFACRKSVPFAACERRFLLRNDRS